MNKIINHVFSEKYVNHVAVADNVVLMMMYRFAYPFAYLLNKLHLSPNQITTQSLVFTILAFLSLSYDKGWGLFSFFWGMAVLLARAAGPQAKVLVDTGHHYQAQNIEQIVAWLLSEKMPWLENCPRCLPNLNFPSSA